MSVGGLQLTQLGCCDAEEVFNLRDMRVRPLSLLQLWQGGRELLLVKPVQPDVGGADLRPADDAWPRALLAANQERRCRQSAAYSSLVPAEMSIFTWASRSDLIFREEGELPSGGFNFTKGFVDEAKLVVCYAFGVVDQRER